jgi:hypothetical protein
MEGAFPQPFPLLLGAPINMRPEDRDLHPKVIELLKKAGEIAKDTGRAYCEHCCHQFFEFNLQDTMLSTTAHPYHFALAILSVGSFSRPDNPVNLEARLMLYFSDLLKEAGSSLDSFRRTLWKYAVRLPIQEGYVDEIYERYESCRFSVSSGFQPIIMVYSIDLVDFLHDSCLLSQYHRNEALYLNYLLNELIRHESLLPVMENYPLSTEVISDIFNRLADNISSTRTIQFNLVEDLTAAEEESRSWTIGRVC